MTCLRCHGTAIDPVHSGSEYYGDGIIRAIPEPCAACQFPQEPVQPYGCAICGDSQDHHGSQWHPLPGLHQWARPTDAQILARMKARRDARLNAEPAKYHATTAWAPDHTGE